MSSPHLFAVRSMHLARHILLGATVLILTGCGQAIIRNPPGVLNGQPQAVDNPVDVRLDWSGVNLGNGPPTGVGLDGASVIANFNINGCCTAQAQFILAPGDHSLSVSAPTRGGPYYENLPFKVSAPEFTLTPSLASVTLTPGGIASVNVTVTAAATHAFNGTIVPTVPTPVTGLPSGVTATATATTPTSMQFRVDLSAAASASPASAMAAINAESVAGSCSNCTSTVTGSATLSVTVLPPFTITNMIPTTPLLVPRGGAQSLNFTVQRVGSFTGPITITANGVGNGVTAPGTFIAAGANSGSITFNATAAAGLGDVAAGTISPLQTVNVTLTGQCTTPCPGAVVSKTVTVKIGRRLGTFATAPPALKNAPSSASSADNTATLQYALANPQPPGQTLFTATFRRSNGNTQLAAIDLAQSPTDWGAGFCPATPTVAGVVLSRTYANQSNAQLYYTLPIWAPAPSTTVPARQIVLPVYTESGSVLLSVIPTLWYSPDCTIAAFPEASGIASTPIALTIIDMRTGSRIGSQMFFTGSFPSNIEVLGNATSQTVRVTFAPSDIRTVPIP